MGAEIHASKVLSYGCIARTSHLLDSVAAEGAFVVGAKVDQYYDSVAVARRLLELGVDYGNAIDVLMLLSPSEVFVDLVKLYATEWFMDIDARDEDDGTVRMLLAQDTEGDASDENHRFIGAMELLRFGADANARDASGMTALDIAMRINRPRAVELLLAHGATCSTSE